MSRGTGSSGIRCLCIGLDVVGSDLRKLILTAHISCSVGWLGAVAVFVALGVAGLTSRNNEVMRGAYLTMDLITWHVIVPLALASVVTGIAASLATPWGLIRHYWVVVKLLLTLFSSFVLAIHIRPIEILAAAAATTDILGADLDSLRNLMVTASGIAAAALLFLTALSVYKPRGVTPYDI